MGNKILIASGLAFWLIAGVFVAGKLGLLNKTKTVSPINNQNVICKDGEEYTSFGPVGGSCHKIPSDAGKPCTKSTSCESGYCVTKEPNATAGVCFDSNAHIPCIAAVWTIEESQAVKRTPGNKNPIFPPVCVY